MNSKWKSFIKCAGFLAGLVLLVSLCDFFFAQSGYIRFILQEVNEKDNNYDTIVLGASHARSAIDPQKIDDVMGTNSINMAIPGETIKDSYYVLKESCRKNKVKKVILDVDYQYWVNPQTEGYFAEPFIYNQLSWTSPVKWQYMVDNMKTLDIRNAFTQRNVYLCSLSGAVKNVKFKTSSTYFKHCIGDLTVSDANGPYVGKGFFYREVSGHDPAGQAYIESWYGREKMGIAPSVETQFNKIKKYCDDNGIELIAVTSPITPSAMKKLGLQDAHKSLQEVFDKNNVKYYDFNLTRGEILSRENKDYGDMEGHMGGRLGQKYSEVLAQLLNDAENGTLELNKYFYSSYEDMYEQCEWTR